MNFWKASTIVLTSALAGVIGFGSITSAHADAQPKMHAALVSLESAKASLEAATPDKGGHRVKAIQATKDAIEETKKGIAADNTNEADANRWDKLGERTVDGKADKDTIVVGRDDGRFKTIQLKVDGSALEMYDVLVTFGDGSSFSPPTRLKFDKGTTSRAIDLPGATRTIKKIDFKYGNLPGGGRAHVELWAR